MDQQKEQEFFFIMALGFFFNLEPEVRFQNPTNGVPEKRVFLNVSREEMIGEPDDKHEAKRQAPGGHRVSDPDAVFHGRVDRHRTFLHQSVERREKLGIRNLLVGVREPPDFHDALHHRLCDP